MLELRTVANMTYLLIGLCICC